MTLRSPNADPIGKRLLMEPLRPTNPVTDDVWEVVGVVADEGLSWNGLPEAMVYATRAQNPSDYMALVVRGTLDPARLQEPIRRAVSAVDPDQALSGTTPAQCHFRTFRSLDTAAESLRRENANR